MEIGLKGFSFHFMEVLCKDGGSWPTPYNDKL